MSTAAGSTGAIRSSGGMRLPISSNLLQYLIREPCIRADEAKQSINEIVQEGEKITIISGIRDSMIWIDGSHHSFPIRYLQEITISSHPRKLNLVRSN